MKVKLIIILTFGLIFQSFAQDKKLSKLELLYNQENYDVAVRFSQKLIDKKGYEDNAVPYLFKALSLSRMNEEHWYIPKKYRPINSHIAEALKAFKELDDTDQYALQYDKYIHATHQQTKEINPDKQSSISFNHPSIKKNKKKKKEENKDTYNKRDSIVFFSKQFLGTPYKYGGTNEAGFDCSGFSCYVLKEVNIDLPRTSRDQGTYAKKIPLKDAEKGDLLFFGRSGSSIHHVGIVVSEKDESLTMIHSSTSSGIMITVIENSDYWKKLLRYAGRVIND